MKTAIIDMDSVAFSIGHPNKQLDKDGNPMRTEDNARFLYTEKTEEELEASAILVMEKILRDGAFDSYIGYIKGKNTTKDRLVADPGYKGNRIKQTPTWWASVKKNLIDRWGIIEVNDMEVDDAVNITRLQVPDSHICAIDNDLLGLHGTHFNWNKRTKHGYTVEWVTREKSEAEYIFWKDVITGQSGDNIKGIPGIGKANPIFTDKLFRPNRNYVLDLYCQKLGEEKGISEFYKNYKCLKIKDVDKDFVIPEIIKYELDVNKEGTAEEWL